MPPRRELVWTHGIDGVQNDAIGHGFFDLWTDERLDQSEQMGLEIAAAHPKAYRLAPDVMLTHRGRRFFVSEVEKSRIGSTATILVEADALWYRLGDLTYVGSFIITNGTPTVGLASILDGTGWTVGAGSTTSSATFEMEQQDKSRLALLRTWSKITGRFLKFDTAAKTVELVDERGTARGLAFRYRRNLNSVRRRARPPALTRLFPYGADDLTIAGVNGGIPYLEDLTYYTAQGLSPEEAAALYTRSRVWSDTAFLKEADLLAAATTRMESEAGESVEYVLDVLDLSEVSNVVEDAYPGDTVGVNDPAFDEDVRPVVTRYRRQWLEPWRNKIELSTILDPLSDGSATSGRPTRSAEWVQFVGPVRGNYSVRNDGDYIVARIPLRFREGGRADFHLDLWVTGVGDGDMIVTIIDAEDEDAQQFKTITVPYTDGETVRAFASWATENLVGSKVYDVRVTTEASGGADPAKGVDIAADRGADDTAGEYEASWWIKAQGAVQETPVQPDSLRFDYTGAVQKFTVPDNVTEVTARVVAGAGGTGGQGSLKGIGGAGGALTITMPVIPGTVYDVYVGGAGESTNSLGGNAAGGWPNGGKGGTKSSNFDAGGGGASSHFALEGAAFADAVAVAGGGGGGAGDPWDGGFGGFLQGGPGEGTAFEIFGAGAGAQGGTQSAGGAGEDLSTYGTNGEDGSFNQGGNADNVSAFRDPGGGGGGGWYGGGSGGVPFAIVDAAGGGGGGSGWLADNVGAFNILIEDASNSSPDDGYIEFSWGILVDV